MSDIKIGRMVIGVYSTNCYFIYRESNKECIVVDPADAGDKIYEALSNKGFSIKAIFLTHGHFDHIWGAKALQRSAGVKIYALEEEKNLCENAGLNVSEGAGKAYTLTPDVCLKDGEEITIADISCKVIATPGHTAGSCCYYFEDAGFLVCGDTIFLESVGRTDFPTGSHSQLVRSVKEKIFTLPEQVILYPGHGDSTSIEHEKQYNPFV